MIRTRFRTFAGPITTTLSLIAFIFTPTTLLAAEEEAVAIFTQAQANAGEAGYAENCASCHGNTLEGFGLVPSLTGAVFASRWGDKSADQLATSVNRMPPGAESSLDPSEYTQILAYLLEHNGMTAGDSALPAGIDALAALTIPTSELSSTGAESPASLLYNSDGPLVSSSRLESLTPGNDHKLFKTPAH
jgi:mono/diheme cytochrome c family protein